jgi:uncharacterized membrane protein YhhN
VYDDFFVFGMIAFGIGHVCYMQAFQFGGKLSKPFGVLLLIILVK